MLLIRHFLLTSRNLLLLVRGTYFVGVQLRWGMFVSLAESQVVIVKNWVEDFGERLKRTH